MHPDTPGRPHSVRRSQPPNGKPEAELALTIDGIVITDSGDEVHGYSYLPRELPARDGRDFRHPIYDRDF